MKAEIDNTRRRLKRGGVYAITPEHLQGAALITAARAALVAGVALLQYRAKPPQLADAKALFELCAEFNVPLIINDDVALAKQLGAGVHLGESDGSLTAARAVLGAKAIIGVSCYNDWDLAEAAAVGGASYLAFGSFFATQTKHQPRRAPPELLTRAKQLGVPLVAIGGIDANNGGDLIKAGAHFLASVQSIFGGRGMNLTPAQIEANAQGLRACFGAARPIKSFVLRQGRLTGGQDRAMQILLPQFGVSAAEPFAPQQVFNNRAPCVLEIGFGNGDALVECAQSDPAVNFVGAEVHAPGVGRALLGIERLGAPNVRVMHGDVVPFLRECVPDGCFERIHVWFPDPWHKARHHKRRLIQPEFVALLASKLCAGGRLHLATDWQNYAEHMLEVLNGQSGEPGALSNTSANAHYCTKPDWRPSTHFERRGLKLGHGVWDLLWRKG